MLLTGLLTPRVGFEPTTLRLTAECSTAELSRIIKLKKHLFTRFKNISPNNQVRLTACSEKIHSVTSLTKLENTSLSLQCFQCFSRHPMYLQNCIQRLFLHPSCSYHRAPHLTDFIHQALLPLVMPSTY